MKLDDAMGCGGDIMPRARENNLIIEQVAVIL